MCDSDDYDMCLEGCYNLRCDRNTMTNKFNKFIINKNIWRNMSGKSQGVWVYKFDIYQEHDEFEEFLDMIKNLYDGVKCSIRINIDSPNIMIRIIDYSNNPKPFTYIKSICGYANQYEIKRSNI